MEDGTQKEHVEERLDYNPMTFSGKYGAESGRISPGKNTFPILDQLYKLPFLGG